MNEVDSIRLEGFRQLKKQIRGSKHGAFEKGRY